MLRATAHCLTACSGLPATGGPGRPSTPLKVNRPVLANVEATEKQSGKKPQSPPQPGLRSRVLLDYSAWFSSSRPDEALSLLCSGAVQVSRLSTPTAPGPS